MSDWLAIHKPGELFSIVKEMASGIDSTVNLPGEKFYAWYHVHEGTVILVAGEGVSKEGYTYPAPDGVVRVQRRGADGISITIDTGGTSYWNRLSAADNVGPDLDEALLAVATTVAENLGMPL